MAHHKIYYVNTFQNLISAALQESIAGFLMTSFEGIQVAFF